ncbi:MAG: hypothetical protein MZW92_71835 [Comamonadaceae bacterium]|nr:hypothetical protein [Comamonadaceae bacterium]
MVLVTLCLWALTAMGMIPGLFGHITTFGKPRLTIMIDGVIDPEEWKDATRTELKYEIDPGENSAPPVATEAFFTYDEENLYVGFVSP